MTRKRMPIVASVVATLLAATMLTPTTPGVAETATPDEATPPVARKIPVADTLFGDVRVDDYRWMRDKSSPEVIAHLEAENEYTADMTRHIEGFRETIYEEMVARIKETDLSVPYLDNGFYYYERTEEGQQYPILCRAEGSLDGEEIVLLDQNQLSEGHDYFEIRTTRVSPDNGLLAYSVDTTGAETFTLFIKDLTTGELLPDVIPEIDYALEWANDSNTLFYTTMDETRRSDRLWRHALGTDPSADALIHHEEDPGYGVWISRTRSDAFLIMDIGSRDTEEQYLLSADDPFGEFALVHPREKKIEYYLPHRGNEFYIRTNDGAKNYKVMKTPVGAPSKDNWTEVIPHRDDVKIERVETFANHLVVAERERGQRRIRVMELDAREEHYIEFPEPVYAVYPSENMEYETATIRFSYMSHVTPTSI
ncbi:MAG: hypothetical protein ABIE42_01870 [Candidatus Eisenbacteria bacterium]